MTQILSTTGKPRTRAQQRAVMQSRLQGLRNYLGALTVLVDPENNFAALFGCVKAGQAVAYAMGEKYRATIRKTREEALIDAGTASFLQRLEPLIAAVELAEAQVIPRDPNASFAYFPRQAWIKIKGEALAAKWEREQPADLFLPLLTDEEAKTDHGKPASTAKEAGRRMLEELQR